MTDNQSETFQIINETRYEIISSNERCIKCRFQYRIIVDDLNEVHISCRHPKGPGAPLHCIYFKHE